MKRTLLILALLASAAAYGQDTWYGDISFFAGGGENDIFRFNELAGAASYSGNGYWTTGFDFRRIFTDHFSLETGLGYSHNYYTVRSAPLPEVTEREGSIGLFIIPVTARVDFLKYFFADAGINLSLQAGNMDFDNLTGFGLTAGLGGQYRFKSDIFIGVRVLANQCAMLHLIPEDNPYTLWNSGVQVSIGYQFIHLGKCNCPESNAPRSRRKFF